MLREIRAIRRLLPLLKLYPWVFPVVLILGILSSLLEGLSISLFIPFLQSLNQDLRTVRIGNVFISSLLNFFNNIPENRRILMIPLCIFAIILIKNIISYSNFILSSWFTSQVGNRLRNDIFKQTLSLSYSFLETQKSGKLLNILGTESWQVCRALTVLIGLAVNSCTVTIFIIILLLISWKLTLAVGMVMALISMSMQWVSNKAYSLGKRAVEANSTLAVQMLEGLGGMRVIRSFGREEYEQKRFEQASCRVQNTFWKMDIISGVVNPLYEIISAFLLVFILIIAVREVGEKSIATLLTFMFILYRLQPLMQKLDTDRIHLITLSNSVQTVLDFLCPDDKPYIISGHLPFQTLQESIKFDNVSFYYQTKDRPAIENISLEFKQGQTTAFVGPSGAGKSTIINLLCRFYEPSNGQIFVDNTPLEHLNLLDWRSQIAIVSQDIHIFSTTVGENITYGRLDATKKELIKAAKLANAHDFITQLPQGYDTPVGDRGVRLSGGQRQRIALARAIIRNPQILILDEATNALDSISENLIQEALKTLSQDRTVIVIAHRLSTIESADKIIVLKQGRVVEQGDRRSLLQHQGLFSELYQLQNRSVQL